MFSFHLNNCGLLKAEAFFKALGGLARKELAAEQKYILSCVAKCRKVRTYLSHIIYRKTIHAFSIRL